MGGWRTRVGRRQFVHYTQTTYYDVTTGALVAIFGGPAIPDTVCANGPPTGIEADCLPGAATDAASAVTDVCLLDAATKG